jgi:transcriptional regulator with XRE-family HTH domain/tetratricopeptide (TPR) repeat protein
MMPRPIPPPLNLALTVLRSSRGWSQKELSAASGLPSGILSDYEMGRRPLTREKLEALAEILGIDPGQLDATLLYVRSLQPVEEPPGPPLSPTREECEHIERSAALVGHLSSGVTREEMTRSLREAGILRDRDGAEAFWQRLKLYPVEDHRFLVENGRSLRTWAVSEKLCAESARAAAADAGRALELADLALGVASQVPGPAGWRSRLQGYAWAFIGNARRVASDLPGAEKAFARAWGLWKAPSPGEEGPLAEWRLLDLEASLRRDQRRLPEALGLLDRALTRQLGEAEGRILLNKAFTLEQMGEYEGAIEALKRAASAVAELSEPRLLCVLRFNLAVSLCHLGRNAEAEELLPGIRALAVRLGNELDLVRALWLEGRISAGLGQRAKAISALERVRADFTSRGIAYDVALATLELTVLYLEEGQTNKVKELARQIAPIFHSQGVHREALAALELFHDAAKRETATVDLARRVVEYLCRARYNPELKFQS